MSLSVLIMLMIVIMMLSIGNSALDTVPCIASLDACMRADRQTRCGCVSFHAPPYYVNGLTVIFDQRLGDSVDDENRLHTFLLRVKFFKYFTFYENGSISQLEEYFC